VVERYQGGVAHRPAEAAASWWHLVSEDAGQRSLGGSKAHGAMKKERHVLCETVSRPCLRAKRPRSVRAVHAALSFKRRHCCALAVPARNGFAVD
jgi:hypothetical protein